MKIHIEQGAEADFGEAAAIDEDAGLLFARQGLVFALPADHPFLVGGVARWRRAVAEGGLWFAVTEGRRVGFVLLGVLDGGLHLDQLSVHTAAQRQGIGRALLAHAKVLAARAGAPLWLTTYAHLPWNGPFYADAGFQTVGEAQQGPGLAAILAAERAALPQPEHRVAMRWEPPGVGSAPPLG